jgi:hypothetical protein
MEFRRPSPSPVGRVRLSAGTLSTSSVAELEDCYLIEKGVGTILHPVRSVQAAPRDELNTRIDELLSAEESAASLDANDSESPRHAVLRAARLDAYVRRGALR